MNIFDKILIAMDHLKTFAKETVENIVVFFI